MIDIFHIDLLSFIKAVGYLGLFGVVFAESGLFFGFFFPGDSLLFAAGLLASEGFLNIWILAPLLVVAAVFGDSAGYWFGAKVGPKIFTREDSFFFHKNHVERARVFYENYGPRAILIARFVPIVRTFVPILAGVGSMRYRLFLAYNIVGGILWGAGVSFLGYFLGTAVPGIAEYVSIIAIAIIIISFAPIVVEIVKNRR